MTFEQTKEQFLLAYNSNAYLNMCESDDMHNAIVALEKQIPKKPKITIYNGYCPQCGEAFGRINIETAALTGFKYFGFCPICGQALDWGDCE
jgi:hypothetical protein